MGRKRFTRGAVLAAGDGDRMGGLTTTRPKALLPVRGKPLIFYPVEALIKAAIENIAVVVGYLGDDVVATLGAADRFDAQISYIFNPDYLGGNAISVSKVREWTEGEPFVLCMGDHMIDSDFVVRFLDGLHAEETLAVDFAAGDRHIGGEATKVLVDSEGRIDNIGKGLVRWNCIDTGVFLLTENFITAIDELLQRKGVQVEISEVIRFMIEEGRPFLTRDMTGSFWADIDTQEDLGLFGGIAR